MQPVTRYAKSGELHIAYQVFGEGSINVVLAPPFISNVEHWWDEPDVARMSGAVERVRPKMMTVFAIMAGLLPIMWNHGTGAEVMQRIAVPMIGGIVSSTLLTLIVIPAIYAVVKGAAMRSPRLALSPQRT